MDIENVTETVEQIRKLRSAAELELTEAAVHIINKFTEQTGITPSSIGIHLIDTTSFASRKKEYTIAGSTIEIEL